MLKPALLTALFAIAAPAAHAGDWNFGITFGKDRKPRFHVSYDGHKHHRHRPRHRVCRPVWVPGHFERVRRPVVIPARYESRWIPPRYEYRYNPCGERVRILVRRGFYKKVLVRPRRVDYRYDRVWVPGHREYRCKHRHHHRDRIEVRNRDRHRDRVQDRDRNRRDGRRGRRNRQS